MLQPSVFFNTFTGDGQIFYNPPARTIGDSILVPAPFVAFFLHRHFYHSNRIRYCRNELPCTCIYRATTSGTGLVVCCNPSYFAINFTGCHLVSQTWVLTALIAVPISYITIHDTRPGYPSNMTWVLTALIVLPISYITIHDTRPGYPSNMSYLDRICYEPQLSCWSFTKQVSNICMHGDCYWIKYERIFFE